MHVWLEQILDKKIQKDESNPTCFPSSSAVENLPARAAGDIGSVPGLGRSPGEGNVYPLQYSFLENFMDRGPWWATVHGVVRNQT